MITDTQDWIADVTLRARAARLTIVELCRQSKISVGTWSRWKNGHNDPTIPPMRRVEAVLDKAEAELP